MAWRSAIMMELLGASSFTVLPVVLNLAGRLWEYLLQPAQCGREGGRGTATCSLWWELRVSFAVLFVVCDEICAILSMFSSSGASLAKSEVTRIPCMMAVRKCFRLVLKRQEGLNYLSGQYLGTWDNQQTLSKLIMHKSGYLHHRWGSRVRLKT